MKLSMAFGSGLGAGKSNIRASSCDVVIHLTGFAVPVIIGPFYHGYYGGSIWGISPGEALARRSSHPEIAR
jgi:hypothetical protein